MTAAGDFFDEGWCKTFGAELFVDAEEIDLNDRQDVRTDSETGGYTKDGGNEFSTLRRADADMPRALPAWRF